MGRRIYDLETGDFIWKYVFAIQDSEQCRVYEELGIGELTYDEETNYDYLTLNRSDIPALEEYLADHHYENLLLDYEQLELDYEGLKVYAKDPDSNQIVTYSVYGEGKTTRELIKKLKDKGYIFINCGCPLDCDYERAVNEFANRYDFYFLKMIHRFIGYMNQHPDRETFTFEGE